VDGEAVACEQVAHTRLERLVMPAPWSREEVEAIVADYFDMLNLELVGRAYNKSAHRRRLLPRLNRRTEASVELKHQNITAALIELGCPHIPGYKPLRNFQNLLFDAVQHRIRRDTSFDRIALEAVEKPASPPAISDPTDILVEAPSLALGIAERTSGGSRERVAVQRNYLEREGRNRSLGLAGEEFVAEFERRRLRMAGMSALGDKVDHVAKTRGDGLGYDVLSFETDGRERFIEVKTTAFGIETPFFISRNEVEFSHETAEHYRLCRLFDFRRRPRMFELRGSVSKNCRLDPVSYMGRFR